MEQHLAAAAVYADRLGDLNRGQARAQQRGRGLGAAKLVIAAGALIAGGLAIHHVWAIAAFIALAVLFVLLAILHERLLNSMRARARVIAFYESGVARVKDQWAGRGDAGERFLDPAHPYARDLDLFGNASLFQYLNTARTPNGEQILAKWLLAAAPIAEINERQPAVRDLATRLRFREQLASAGESVRNSVHPDQVGTWGESGAVLSSPATRAIATVLALAWIAGLAVWATTDALLPAIAITVLNFAYAHRLQSRVEQAAAGIEKSADDLRVLSEVLRLIECEDFHAPWLLSRRDSITRRGEPSSRAIRRLARLADLIESRHSLFARPLDAVLFWSTQTIFLAESWKRKFGPEIRTWLAVTGEIEAMASLATFAYEHPEYAIPEFAESGVLFDALSLAHPLLPNEHTVGNDVTLSESRQLMILSGPNMAGKSTFIRSLGVNAVLAQCGAPVRAQRLRMSPQQVAASICILDSLSGGTSRFYAEIRRVKQISDLATGSVPVLFLLDELLSGTNSHDRFLGTQFVLRTLVSQGAIGVVSTHDLALTHIPDTMQGRAFNAHFEDRLEHNKLVFDYKLKPGVVQTSNALQLMRAIGLGVSDE